MRKLKLGMVGGAPDGFIGRVHIMASMLDNEFELVCGAFSASAEKSKEAGKFYHVSPHRTYGSYKEMFEKEATLPMNERMDAVAIVTPNYLHFEPTKMALEAGFNVICDKPVTFSLQQAIDLKKVIYKSGLIFALTHTYNGYPMIKEARERVTRGDFGKIRKVMVEYTQGWLADKVEDQGQKQALWRTNPALAGASCTMADIGVHAFNLAEYVSGLAVSELSADITSFVPGRVMEDDGSVLVHFSSGAKGVILASQICAGEENSVRLQVYGEKGGLEWQQMDPNTLIVKWKDKPKEIIRTNGPCTGESAKLHARVPAGHPEGYIEAFANLYRNFALAIHQKSLPLHDFPGIEEGIRGMRFIELCMESSAMKSNWMLF